MTLKNVLEEICAEEYALPENAPRHRFRLSHRRAVNAVFYPNGFLKTEKKPSLKRRAVVIAAVVALAMVTGAAASFYHYNGFAFRKDKHEGEEYYVMLVENKENAPQTIEKLIYDDNMPKDFTFRKITSYNGEFVQNHYLSAERVDILGRKGVSERKGVSVGIEQCTKHFFVNPITDDFIAAPVEVKGCKGFTITPKDGVIAMNVVIWDSGDYIHIVNGLLTLDELLEIAENMIELK